MIPEEMLRAAAVRSCAVYTQRLERGCESEDRHVFSPRFERRIRRLKRRADHPLRSRALRCAASIALALLLGGGVWLSVDVEARAAFFGWIMEIYETHIVYRFSDDIDTTGEARRYEPGWIPDGYTKSRETDTGAMRVIIYKDRQGQLLNFLYVYDPSEANVLIETEGAVLKTAQVGDYQADVHLFEDRNVGNNIVWSDRYQHIFVISAFLSEEDLVRLANSVYQ